MKILQVTPGYYPVIGGVEKHVQALSERLVARGHAVTVATMRAAPDCATQEWHNGVAVRRFEAVGVGDAYRVPRGLLRFLKTSRNDYDIVHVHNYHAALIPLVALSGRPFIATTHLNDTPHSATAMLLHIPYRVVGRWAVSRAQAVICVTQAERDRIAGRLGVRPERSLVIPNGVSESLLSARASAQRDAHLLLSVGRLQAYKRVEDAITALALLGEPYRLAVVGEGPHRASLEQLARERGVADRVVFVGQATDEALISWYGQAGILLALSEAEAFGMTVLEGVAAGARVVCSDIPAFRDLAGQFPAHVVVAPRRDPAAVAEAVRRAADGAAVPADIAAYTWDAVTDRLLQVYRQVTGVGETVERRDERRLAEG